MTSNRLEFDRLRSHWPASTWEETSAEERHREMNERTLPAWAQRVEQCIADHPRAMVISAIALGIILGWLGKRK